MAVKKKKNDFEEKDVIIYTYILSSPAAFNQTLTRAGYYKCATL